MRLFYLGIYNSFEPQNGMRRALRSIATNYDELDWATFKKSHGKDFGKALINRVNNFTPDIVFMQIQTPNIITPEIAKQIKGVKVNWTGDVREDISWYIDVAPFVNVTLFTNMDDVYTLRKRKLRSDFLQVSVDDTIYNPTGRYVDFAPIVFFGNNYRNKFPLSDYRYRICSQLKRDYGNQFAIFGNGWHGLESWNLNHRQEKEAMILRGAKIALSISHFNYERYFSDRLLRAMFCGAMVISHDYKGLDKDFTPNKHLAVFKDYEHLTNIIDNALRFEGLRKEIANNGCNYAMQNFSYKKFSEYLISLIDKYK